MQYLPIEGLAAFNKATAELLFGAGHPVIKEQKVCLDLVFMSLTCFIRMFFFFLISLALHDQVATIQGLSGTGSLRLAAALIERYFNGAKVLISAPTWGTY